MKSSIRTVLVLLGLVLPFGVSAAPITKFFELTLDQVTNPAGIFDGFAVGDTITGSYVYDDTATNNDTNPLVFLTKLREMEAVTKFLLPRPEMPLIVLGPHFLTAEKHLGVLRSQAKDLEVRSMNWDTIQTFMEERGLDTEGSAEALL